MAAMASRRLLASRYLKPLVPSSSSYFVSISPKLQNPNPTTSPLPSALLPNPSNPPFSLPDLRSFFTNQTPIPYFSSATVDPKTLPLSLTLIRPYSDSVPREFKTPGNPSSDRPAEEGPGQVAGSGSGDDEPPSDPGKPRSSEDRDFRHQEIEGPTVERDLSALADETREVLGGMMKTIYGLSTSVAVLALAQLALGAWVLSAARAAPIPEEALIASCAAAFGFPLSVAVALRRSLKPMLFFRKMEEQGRLQVLTLALQVVKNVDLFFARVRGVSRACVAGIFAALLFTLVFGR